MLEQYKISDFIEWNRQKRLLLNPNFQRGSVWIPAARVFLIDTILRNYPVPKIYLRSTIDVRTQDTVREVVDGQQRLKAILDFANDKFRLTSRAGEFNNNTYSTLTDEYKTIFLNYPLAVEHLLNASEDDVLEVFARLNTYNVALKPAEKRHARYQGKFKWCVRNLARDWSVLWTRYEILTTRQRVRMDDDVVVAEILMIAAQGLTDGGSNKVDRFYKDNDHAFPDEEKAVKIVTRCLTWFTDNIGSEIAGTRLASAPQFIVLFAAIAHRLHGIPKGDIQGDFPPPRRGMGDISEITENLMLLASALEADEVPDRLSQFVQKSSSSTQRIASREVRFEYLYRALSGDSI